METLDEYESRFQVMLVPKSSVASADRVVVFVFATSYKEARKKAKALLKSPTRWKYGT